MATSDDPSPLDGPGQGFGSLADLTECPPRSKFTVGALVQLVNEVSGGNVKRVGCFEARAVCLEDEVGSGHAAFIADVATGRVRVYVGTLSNLTVRHGLS